MAHIIHDNRTFVFGDNQEHKIDQKWLVAAIRAAALLEEANTYTFSEADTINLVEDFADALEHQVDCSN